MLDKVYRHEEVEARQYALWETSGAFSCDLESVARPYTIMMPPPNVTGSLHMGHALNLTIQDILIRRERMQGRAALWQPGTDHAGIATQMVVEGQLAQEGLERRTLGREAFIERIWRWRAESGGAITRQLRRLGASADWAREQFTMDEGLSQAVLKVFVDLYKERLIYRDKRLVNWDCRLHTAISDLEVEQRVVKGSLWYVKYPIEGEEGAYITVATTRPETMLGDTGVAVHPEDDRYRHLIGRSATLPLVGRRLRIIADPYSDPEKGSGAVKITPAHDFNDFEVGRRHKLDLVNILDHDGRLNDGVPEPYRGLDRFEARARVVKDLEAQGLLEKVEDYEYSLPYGDRSGVVIEPWLTDQWFVDAATLAKPAIEAVEEGRTRFVPRRWESTYFEWMRNIQPWCVSRQIWWGHQIPAWYGPDGKVFVELTEEEAEKAARAHYGEAAPLERDKDVLDAWFSSALWPFSTLGWPQPTAELKRHYPTDVLVTGFDIIFFWVARMMMMGLHFMEEVPFRTVYIHALVRDERGQKMSKSKGNVLDPLDLMDKYGGDALRFTLAAMAAQGRDIKLSESRIEGHRNFVTKLWNAARFCEMNGCRAEADFDPGRVKLTVNRWIIGELVDVARSVDEALKAYKFNEAASGLYRFVWGAFCDWYLEFTKPVLDGPDGPRKDEVRATAAWTLDQILLLLHPLMPYVTEELWTRLAPERRERLISAPWPSYPETCSHPGASSEMNWVVRLISEVRSARAELNVPPAARLMLLHQGLSDKHRTWLVGDQWRRVGNAAQVMRLARLDRIAPLEDDPPEGSVQIVIEEGTFVLPLADVINVAKEAARLERQVDRLGREIARIDAKLGDENFSARAPEHVIEAQRERLAEAEETRRKLQAALARLEGV